MLVGDAAGVVDPWTGGGINLGFQSAAAAAEAASIIINANHNDIGNGNGQNLNIYKEKMRIILKNLRFKGNLLNLIIWLYDHKLTGPMWEQFFLKHTTQRA